MAGAGSVGLSTPGEQVSDIDDTDDDTAIKRTPPILTAPLMPTVLRPLWPEAFCLEDRMGDVFIGHWFLLTVAALFELERPQHTVRLYAYWLDPAVNARALKSFHVETMELLKPEFVFTLGLPELGETCIKFRGSDVWHTDRQEPARGVIFLRQFFMEKIAAVAPFAPANASNLYYLTRKGAGEGKVAERQGAAKRRDILNEDSFLPTLVAMGFKLIKLEDFSVADKIRLFASARMVVGPNSAGLGMAAVWAARGADVVEIFPNVDLMMHSCYISRASGAFWQRYSAVDTVGEPPDKIAGNSAFNLIVRNTTHLLAHVNQLLANPDARERAYTCRKRPVFFADD